MDKISTGINELDIETHGGFSPGDIIQIRNFYLYKIFLSEIKHNISLEDMCLAIGKSKLFYDFYHEIYVNKWQPEMKRLNEDQMKVFKKTSNL